MPGVFKRGALYARRDVLRLLGLPEGTWGGNWFTGYNEHGGAAYVFANVGTAGRTGHDYANAWEGHNLRWFAKNRSSIRQPQVKRLIDAATPVHIFWRTVTTDPFTYAGRGRVLELKDSSPVEILCRFAEGMDPGFSKPFPPEFLSCDRALSVPQSVVDVQSSFVSLSKM
jgi:hypothetical protein